MAQKIAQKETYNEALAKARKAPPGAVTPSQADRAGMYAAIQSVAPPAPPAPVATGEDPTADGGE